ncbi:related to TMA16 Protein putative involved in cytoplasmic ribosome function [Cephalotrichum gorgonifer]|uniref:Related to TMA16 Protein putative involved in cytoplasmic ribosome function n=1 Tax=Cephalotrichum gorgonifer TaxID=2041049 RepID=A0AAE8N460_9PEZI|nr:related to TMA16 Protein putative involved in cytoplasmic ribosome function [Cephalotrichum gorgonifer]
MGTSTLDKQRKAIQKKRNGTIDALHQYSRDSKRLRQASIRDARLDKLAANRGRKEKPFMDRAAFFRDRINELRVNVLTQEQVAEFTHQLVHQLDEELAAEKKARRPGRPASTKEDLLRRRVEALTAEHETGFLVPELTTEANVARLERWAGSGGTWSYICAMEWVRVSKSGQVKPAVFPPSSGNH